MPGLRVTDNDGDSIGAYLTWNGDVIGLAWSDSRSGTYDIYFQSFDAALQPLSAERRVTRTQRDSFIPAIVPWQSGFLLAWGEVELSGPHNGDPTGSAHSVVVMQVIE